jgi:hypothetical protein
MDAVIGSLNVPLGEAIILLLVFCAGLAIIIIEELRRKRQ